MYCRTSGSRILFSSDGLDSGIELDGEEFSDIACPCASLDGRSIILTAARSKDDVADVTANRRGDYYAYRLSAGGTVQLTDEYTNTAIQLPHESSIAYSNGSALVVRSPGATKEFKVGRFKWGPPSLSCSEGGTLIAMTRWEGDRRKFACLDARIGEIRVSDFSFYPYVIVGDKVYYARRLDVMEFDPASGHSESVTNTAFQRRMLESFGLRSVPLSNVEVEFSRLTSFEGRLVANVEVLEKETYDCLRSAVVTFSTGDLGIGILKEVDPDWRVRCLSSTGDTLFIHLSRSENLRVVETYTTALGKHAALVEQG